MLYVMLFCTLNMLCTFTLALPIVCVQCPKCLHFLYFVLSVYFAEVLSEWFWGGIVAHIIYWYHFCFHIPQALNIYCKIFIFQNLLSFFFITFLSPEIATYINIHIPFLSSRIMTSVLLIGVTIIIITNFTFD